MAYVISVKNSQNEFINTGFLFQSTFYVDDQYVDGLESGCFVSAMSGNSVFQNFGDTTQATMGYAGKDIGRKADGILYRASAADRYGRLDSTASETRLYPYGKRESVALGFLKKTVIEISDTTSMVNHYSTASSVIGLTGVITANTNIISIPSTQSTSGIVYGSKINIEFGAYSEIFWVENIITDGINPGQIVLDRTVPIAITLTTITVMSQIEDLVYLNNEPTISVDDAGSFSERRDLPFTTVPTSVSGEIRQVVGFVESAIAVRINLELDINPATISDTINIGTAVLEPDTPRVGDMFYELGTGPKLYTETGWREIALL